MVTISASKGVYDSDPSPLPCGCHGGGRCSMLVDASDGGAMVSGESEILP